MLESWRSVVGFEKLYLVSNWGRVRKKEGRRHGEILIAGETQRYKQVSLMADGHRYHRDVHRLVAEAFLGVHPGLVVNHKDHNRYNNRVGNLEWITQRENVLHAMRAGRMPMERENGRFVKVGKKCNVPETPVRHSPPHTTTEK